MTVQRLHSSELEWALPAFRAAAPRLDPFHFEPRTGALARLASMGPFHMRSAEYAALAQAAPGRAALLANLHSDGRLFGDSLWSVSLTEYPFERLKRDRSWNGIGQSAIAAEDGSWVVVVSDEGFGVISGDERFVNTLQARLPYGGDLVTIIDRLAVAQPEPDAELIRLVARLYGDKTAREMATRLKK